MKRIVAMFFAVLLAVLTVPATAKAADEVTLTITADKSTVNPGDTVTFTVSIGPVGELGLGGLEFDLLIPDGMTIIDESVSIPEGLADVFDTDADEIVKPRNGWPKWSHSSRSKGYAGTATLQFLTFSCIVSQDAELGEKSIDVNRDTLTCFDNSLDLNEYSTTIVPAAFTVEKGKIAVSNVTLDKETLTLKEGETTKLTATVEPENADNTAVTWGSDNPAIATVAADGTVTAVKSGTAKITVTTEDGGKTASCAVTVACIHTMTKTEAVEPDCEKDGNVEYYSCSKCGKIFADEAGTKELADVVIKAKGHSGNEWLMDEESHWKVCSVCGKELKEAHKYASDTDSDCNVCGYKRFYIVTSGADAVYEIGTEAELTITADGDYKLFKELQVDGDIVDAINYEVKEGSTVITLKKAYLDTLSSGKHTIRVIYADGKTASAVFTVKEKADDTGSNSGGNDAGSNAGNNIGSNTGNNIGSNTGNNISDSIGNNTGNNVGNNTDNNADASSDAQTSQNQSNIDSPRTGDEGGRRVWIVLAVSSLVLAAGAFGYRRKRERE